MYRRKSHFIGKNPFKPNKILKRLSNFLIFTHLFLATAYTACAYETFLIFNLKPLPLHLSTVFLGTLVLYNTHTILRKPVKSKDSLFKPRYKWIEKNSKLFWTLTLTSLLTLLALSKALIVTQNLEFALIATLISLAYIFNLRKYGPLKVFWIILSMVFILIVWNLPANQLFSQNGIHYIALNSLFFGALTLPFDYRDQIQDKQEKIQTLPNIIGQKNTKYLILILYTGLIASFLFNPTYLTQLPIYCLGFILTLFLDQKRGEFYYCLGIEGLLLLKMLITWIYLS